MRYTITVVHDRKTYRYFVEHTVIDSRTEHFKLIAKNKTLTIVSNRPLFRNKGLKHRRYDLKIPEKDINVWNTSFQAAILKQIEKLVGMFLDKERPL